MKRGRVRRSVKALERLAVLSWSLALVDRVEWFVRANVLRGYAYAMGDMGEHEANGDAMFLYELAVNLSTMDEKTARAIVKMHQLPGVGGGL